MRTTTRIGALALATTAALAMATAPATAGGKAAGGCSTPYKVGTYGAIVDLSTNLIGDGRPFPTTQALLDLLISLDHNGNGSLCYKTPPGWDGPPATNSAQKQDFVNLVDDKVTGD